MTRYTHKQYLNVRYAQQIDAVGKLYDDLHRNRVAHIRLGTAQLLATRASKPAMDSATASETQQQGTHANLSSDHHEFGANSQNTKQITIEERLKKLDEVVAHKPKANPSGAVELTLEERVTRLEDKLTNDIRIRNSPENCVEGPAAVHGLGMAPLLESLHRNEWDLERHNCYDQQSLFTDLNVHGQPLGPTVRFNEMPWDLMQPESVRPFVMTTVSNIAIIARRLGMSWKAFSPEGGSMRAEGNNQGIFSTTARCSGLVLQYIHLEGGLTSVEKSKFPKIRGLPKAELYIPTRDADMMGFGILPGCDRLSIPYFKVGTAHEVYAAMDILDSTGKASSKLKDINRLLEGKWDAHCMYGFSDIIALAAPMIRRRHSTIVRVPTPAEYCSSLLSYKECFVVFYNRLKEYLGTRSDDVLFEQADWVLMQYERLKSRYSEWEDCVKNNSGVNDRDLNFLEEVHDCWDTTTAYFVQLQETHHLHYLDLMSSHISHAVNYWGDAWGQLKQGKARDNYGLRALEAEGSHLYFDYLPLIVEDMRKKGFEGPEKLVHEAWFTLMFRAFCWWRCHSVHPGEDQSHKGSTLPSRYWDLLAHFAEDAFSETTSASPIETIIPNRSYIVKLDCISCPYLIRHFDRNEWEEDPRPNQLTLALYIDGRYPYLCLQGESLNPLYYERRAPSLYSQPYPFAPPFTANQIGRNQTLQQEESNNKYGIPIRQFELAYELNEVTYAPTDRVLEWEVLIEFEITGLRHEEHVPKDIPFVGVGLNKGIEGVVPGVTSIVRLVLGYTEFEEKIVTALELMPKERMAQFAGKEIEALRKAAELKGEKSITTANWGGRLRDINGPDGKDMYTTHVSFKPGEWNDCGRKDDWKRQTMCKLDDYKAWSPVAFVMALILLAVVLVVVFILVVFVSWLTFRFLRSRESVEKVMAKGEDDALLLYGDEELEGEEEKNAKRGILATKTLNQAVHTSEQNDSQQFGPYQHNTSNNA